MNGVFFRRSSRPASLRFFGLNRPILGALSGSKSWLTKRTQEFGSPLVRTFTGYAGPLTSMVRFLQVQRNDSSVTWRPQTLVTLDVLCRHLALIQAPSRTERWIKKLEEPFEDRVRRTLQLIFSKKIQKADRPIDRSGGRSADRPARCLKQGAARHWKGMRRCLSVRSRDGLHT